MASNRQNVKSVAGLLESRELKGHVNNSPGPQSDGRIQAQWHLVQVLAVDSTGTWPRYTVAKLGLNRVATGSTKTNVRAVDDTAAFEVGDYAIMLDHPDAPPILVSAGGSGGSSALPDHVHDFWIIGT